MLGERLRVLRKRFQVSRRDRAYDKSTSPIEVSIFSPDMALMCDRDARVRKHLDKIIVDGTDETRQFKDTVYLEGSMCVCSHLAFGGCPRGEFAYWREIWLQRPAKAGGSDANRKLIRMVTIA